MIHLDADAAVVGGGLAGLTAALRLAQSGRRVVVLEAGDDPEYMCNSRIASGSLQFAQSNPTAEPSFLADALRKETDGFVDRDLARAMAASIGPALRWLEGQGARLDRIRRPGRQDETWSLAPPRPSAPGFGWKGRGPDLALKSLTEAFTVAGGRLLLGARCQEIEREGGAIARLRAKSRDDDRIVRTTQIVLADGGFQSDRELVRRYVCANPEALVQRNAGVSFGAALRMAEALGGQLVDMASFYGHLLSQDALHDGRLWPYPTLDALVGASILVSRGGERFVDEGIGGVALSNALARMNDPLCATAIFDDATWESVGRSDFTPPNPYVPQCGGTLVTASSIEDLARALDLPKDALSRSVDAFNAAVIASSPASLTPPRSRGSSVGAHDLTTAKNIVRSIAQPPFHAIPVCAGLTYTMGGIQVDAGARVVDKERRPISGLYAVGSCVGGAEGGPRVGYLGGLCKSLSLGFIAAESIAAAFPEG